MTSRIHGYLSDLGRRLHLEPRETEEILHELRDHIEDRVQDLVDSGVPSDQALTSALKHFGASRKLAGQLYEAHSRGSWYHTALAVLPHTLLALIFALHLWAIPALVAGLMVVALVISFFGWRKGRPNWTYPWLGYCLLVPILSWGLAMSAVGYGAWWVVTKRSLPLSLPIYLASFAYIAFSLWAVIRIVSKVARRDWVMASLSILPMPFLAYWFFYFYSRKEVLQSAGQPVRELDSSVAIVFLILAAATAIFFRIGRRLVRVAILVITAPSMVVLAWLSYQGGPGHMAIFAFAAISLAVLLSPALFDLTSSRSEESASLIEDAG